jgi:hypothetical protein
MNKKEKANQVCCGETQMLCSVPPVFFFVFLIMPPFSLGRFYKYYIEVK